MSECDLWVVIPFYNEADWISGAIEGLAAQQNRNFTLLLVDNNSTDGTADVAREIAKRHPHLDLRVIDEAEKGTGAAADTGFRYAIANGATYVIRTDADCVPEPQWTRVMREALERDGLDLVGGRLTYRTDDGTAPRGAFILFPLFHWIVRTVARYRPNNNAPGTHGPFILAPGPNLGIRADVYLRCGGFPRSSIEQQHEDKALTNRVRHEPSKLGYRRDAVVRFSNRRSHKHGIVNVLRWYFNHSGSIGQDIVDVR